ncbi:MAG: DUF2264 domain-containing protein [Tannerella sp.]|jgi:hypothetical protein|nr:DUF2264 domain-containing protein [Tannerella sp.]
MKRRIVTVFAFIFCVIQILPLNAQRKKKDVEVSERQYWCDLTYQISYPLLNALSKGELKKQMPVEQQINASGREHFAHLEGFGRLLCGIAPWLELGVGTGKEGEQRAELTALALRGIRQAVDPNSPDYMNFTGEYGRQPLVDAAFLAQAFLRSPDVLWKGLTQETQQMVIDAFKKTREITPYHNNWLLFAGTIEAFFLHVGEEWDGMRIDYAIRQHEQWYKGDGMYGDGPDFHWDYYNSFVIQPMMVDIGKVLREHDLLSEKNYQEILKRSVRYATVLERMISPEGTYPPIGRSLAYRMGALQSLSQMALMKLLPKEIAPAQVRCALTTVMKRQMTAVGTFDENGWLRIGFCGSQLCAGETYICTGSLYLCSVGLLALGLPPEDEFWNAPEAFWTQKKAWGGNEFPIDHALY